MTHKLITDEMVERAASHFSFSDPMYDPFHDMLRAALEAMADDLIEAVAKELDECAKRGAYSHGPSGVARSLKSQGQ